MATVANSIAASDQVLSDMGSEINNPFSDMTRVWLEMTAAALKGWAGSTTSPEIFHQGRADFVQFWNDWCEQWMRSPTFLEAQKNYMDGNLAFRKQFRANLRRMQKELQIAGRDDIDALLAAVQRSQSRILDQLEDTSERMVALEAKLDDLSGTRPLSGCEDGAAGRATSGGNGGTKRRRHEPKVKE